MDPQARRPRAPSPRRGVQIRIMTIPQNTKTTFRQAPTQAARTLRVTRPPILWQVPPKLLPDVNFFF